MPDLHARENEWTEILAFPITPSAAGNKCAKIREKWSIINFLIPDMTTCQD